MSYSKSERAFEYAKPFLEELANSDQDSFTWEISDSRDFARRLRQGIYAAKHRGNDKLGGLLNKFQFKEVPGKVTAIRRMSNKIVPIPVGIHRTTFEGVGSFSELITEVIKNSHVNVLHFPNVELNEDELEQLSKFCKAKGWAYNMTRKELQKCLEPQKSESLTN